MKKQLYLLRIFITKDYYKYIGISIVAFLFSHFLFSYRNLDNIHIYEILERYTILIGVILCTPIFEMERDIEIWSLIKSKKSEMYVVYICRFLASLVVLSVVMALFVWKTTRNCVEMQDAKRLWCGVMSEAIFLGSIGLLVSAISNRMLLGVMVSGVYYLFNICWSGAMGRLSLFGMLNEREGFEMPMIVCAFVLVFVSLFFRENFYCIACKL